MCCWWMTVGVCDPEAQPTNTSTKVKMRNVVAAMGN